MSIKSRRIRSGHIQGCPGVFRLRFSRRDASITHHAFSNKDAETLRSLTIKGSSGSSAIHVGEPLRNLGRYLNAARTVVITDDVVGELYGPDLPDGDVIQIGIGEGIKTLDTVHGIYDELLQRDIDRSAMVVGVGGGIVCDIAGFVASTYMRGVRFGFVSSTLLAQVDASVGGKNGVNFKGFKNMVGVFNQPEFVICDLALLKTLPKKELLCGFGEVVKHGVIADSELFSYLEVEYEKALSLDSVVIERLVCDSIVIKSGIVNRDEKEGGERRKLNFGHTFGHAIEKTTGVPHGEAVGLGMVAAVGLSVSRGHLSPDKGDRIIGLISKMQLPTQFSGDRGKIMDALRKDKKREGDLIYFVLLRDIGDAFVESIAIEEIESAAGKVLA